METYLTKLGIWKALKEKQNSFFNLKNRGVELPLFYEPKF